MQKEYTYNAFISYRHLEPDQAVAEKVQKLIEQYRPPKGIKPKYGRKHLRLFRDKTELPTSGNLDDALKQALLDSEYLIVILSEETKNSLWCMAEIREFKAAHNGSISHILPVLVSGNPAKSIPPELRRANPAIPQEDGSILYGEERDMEPLCADVREDDRESWKKKLKTEFLRLAAPLLGCGYDDLYRRHVRRQRKRQIAATFVFAALAAAFGTMAYTINKTEKMYERNLVNTYTQQGSSGIIKGNDQEAMTYFGNALAIDGNVSAARSGALLMLQQSRWPYLTNAREEALDAAYQVTYQDDTIRIIERTERISTDIPRPTELNPAIDPEWVDLAESAYPRVKYAAGRAIVRYGEYVYDYDLTQEELILNARIDLAEIFPKEAEARKLTEGDLWISGDASLIAVDCNDSVAVISMEDQIVEAVKVNNFYSLNDVVFSHDMERFALVYGNYMGIELNNPGGYVQVFGLNGDTLFESAVVDDVAFQGAAFSPKDSILIAWGSGALEFYDLGTGGSYAEKLKCPSLASAAFQDGVIVVDDGQGTLYDCAFSVFSLKEDGTGEASEAGQSTWNKKATRENTVQLAENLLMVRGVNRVRMMDGSGQTLSEASIEGHILNRMLVDSQNRLVYVWYRSKSGMFCIPYDAENPSFGEVRTLGAEGFEIMDALLTGDGLLIMTGNGYLLYYDDPQGGVPKSMKLGINGVPRELAVNENGLAGVLVVSAEPVSGYDSYHFNEYFSVELWDLNMAVRVAEFEAGNTRQLSNVSFDERGFLRYEKWDETVQWRLDAPVPDAKTVLAIRQLPCFSLDENQAMTIRNPRYEGLELGNWGELLAVEHYSEISEEAPEITDEESIIAEAGAILERDGADAWLAYYDAVWDRIESGELRLDFSEISALFRDYSNTARANAKLTDRIGRGVAVYRDIAVEQSMTDEYGSLTFDIQMMQTLVLTDAYDALMAEYWDFCAEYALDRIRETGEMDMTDYVLVYENRLYQKTVEGLGEQAFREAYAEIGTEYLSILDDLGFGVYESLVREEPEAAALAFDSYVDAWLALDPRKTLDDILNDINLLLFPTNLFARCNGLDDGIMDRFIGSTGYIFGVELGKLTEKNRAAGLQAGDVIVAVNGHFFCNAQHARLLMRNNPKAALTYLRNGETHTTELLDDPSFTGDYIVRKKS